MMEGRSKQAKWSRPSFDEIGLGTYQFAYSDRRGLSRESVADHLNDQPQWRERSGKSAAKVDVSWFHSIQGMRLICRDANKRARYPSLQKHGHFGDFRSSQAFHCFKFKM
jgi:hypothetical protein